MAKIKTVKELKDEAERFLSDAKKQHALLLKKAQEVEEKALLELAKKSIEFLTGAITENELRTIAVELKLIENSILEKETPELPSSVKKENAQASGKYSENV